jgi:3-isopropylmalate/(R)-2-methylmalate dehydratase small subunit
VDLQSGAVTHPGLGVFRFSTPETQKQALLQGIDDIGSTLINAQRIAEFEVAHTALHPWI